MIYQALIMIVNECTVINGLDVALGVFVLILFCK